MSNSSLATEKYLAHPNNYTKGRTEKISEITIHHMAGILSAKECGSVFQRNGRKASSNYGIGKNGEIAIYVDEKDTSWCNSNWKSNCRSVTIETSNCSIGGDWLVSDEVLNSLIKLVADIGKRNNLGTLEKGKNVTWHRMYVNTTCPGDYLLSKMDYIISEANKINNNISCETPHNSNEEIAKEVIAGKWGNGEDRKNRLTKAGYNYSKIQEIVNSILTNKKNKKSNEEIAKEVIAGKWGNGEERKNRLTKAGYNHSEIQKIVNSIL